MRGNASRTVVGRIVVGGALVALVLGITVVPSGARTTAKPTGDPVKVMVIYEKSDGIASPEIPDGAQAAAKAFNKADGIGGRPVKVLVCDTKNDPNVATDCGQQAIDEGVVALVGVLTPHSGSFMPLMVENKVPSIGNVLASADDFQSEASFPITGGIVATSGNLPRFLADAGAKTISVARPDLAEGAVIKLFGDTALTSVGQSIKNDVPVPTDAPDMSTYVQAALAGGTDGIVVALPGQQAINFVQAAKQVDPEVKLAIISTEPGPVQDALGSDAAGIIQGPAYLPVSTKGNKDGQALREGDEGRRVQGHVRIPDQHLDRDAGAQERWPTGSPRSPRPGSSTSSARPPGSRRASRRRCSGRRPPTWASPSSSGSSTTASSRWR